MDKFMPIEIQSFLILTFRFNDSAEMKQSISSPVLLNKIQIFCGDFMF